MALFPSLGSQLKRKKDHGSIYFDGNFFLIGLIRGSLFFS